MRQVLLVLFLFFPTLGAGEQINPAYKPAPTRPPREPFVNLEWMEILDDCFPEKICVQGHLLNNGSRAAKNVKLKIEIGGTKTTPPRTSFLREVDQKEMQPNDRQDFDLTLDRRHFYKEKGKEKVIEIGKYNFKIVPIWTETEAPKPIPVKKPLITTPIKKTPIKKQSVSNPTKKKVIPSK